MQSFITVILFVLLAAIPAFALELEWVDTINSGNWLDKMKLQSVRTLRDKGRC
jgi:hypothetical protein